MIKRMTLCVLAVVAISTGSAYAGHDDSSDPARCDRWWRQGHTDPASSRDSHDHDANSDITIAPAGTTVHQHSGHIVVRNQHAYLEVVGGGSYRGPDPNGRTYPGQGGYVQGEIDAGSGTPDGDFHVDAFGPNLDTIPPSDPTGWAQGAAASACVNIAGHRVSTE